MVNRTLQQLALGVIASIVLAGCGGPAIAGSGTASAPSSPAATANGPAPGATKITVSYSNLVADELPVWIAKEGGYFQKNGLDVTLNYIQSSTGIAALLSGETQAFQGGGSETLSAAVGGGDLEIVASIVPVYPFALEVPANVTDASELKGKRLGVSSFGSSSDIATRVALQKLGLNPDTDTSIITVGSESSRISALLNGAIQGGVAQPPARYDIESHGFHSIYDLAAQHVPSANTAVVFKKAYADSHKNIVQAYVNSIVEAISREKSDEAFSTKVLGQYLKLDNQDSLNRTWAYYVQNIVPSVPEMQPDQLTDAIKALSPKNPNIQHYDVSKLIDNEFVKNAATLAQPAN